MHDSRAVRYTFITIGVISLLLGIVGIVTPILPTTPFILLSGFCFARGSERLHDWILSHRYFGPMIIAFRDEKRIPLKVKIFASLMIAVTMSITAFFIVPLLAVKIGMGVVGVAVIGYIWTFRH
ncbi:MAG TPA: YbaN family protein [Turneriella sp.]|nr:YbaN family protein [Turneriella sp.]HMY10838.1 YbaN family protein [Turneriella sp.]HNA78520.1 YbaN family protein [Turneriella sp.]HNE18143.1 YbaN family protein [Turneriella sp.]HNJ66443.1 YbaN family protein [Turneriella sp.]